MPKPIVPELNSLGMCVFAGLVMRGVADAGFTPLAHLEHGSYGVPSAKLNYPGLDIRVGKETWNAHEFTGKVDYMMVNPPCAEFSNMRNNSGEDGHWSAQVERLGYIKDCTSVGLQVRPKAFTWECVVGAWSLGHSLVMEQAYRWVDAGYSVSVVLIDAQRLGVPQRRHRMMFTAHQHPLSWPAMVQPTTVRQVLEALPARLRKAGSPKPPIVPKPLSPFMTRLWKYADGFGGHLAKSYEILTEAEAKELRAQSNGVMCYKPLAAAVRVDPDRAAPVMLSDMMRFHPFEPRSFDWFEWLALCGLPLDWKTSHTRMASGSVELARAVMPGVGKWFGEAVRDGLALPKLGPPEIRLVDLRYEGREVDEALWTQGEPRLVTEHYAKQKSLGDIFSSALGVAQGQAIEPAMTPEQAIKRLCF